MTRDHGTTILSAMILDDLWKIGLTDDGDFMIQAKMDDGWMTTFQQLHPSKLPGSKEEQKALEDPEASATDSDGAVDDVETQVVGEAGT